MAQPLPAAASGSPTWVSRRETLLGDALILPASLPERCLDLQELPQEVRELDEKVRARLAQFDEFLRHAEEAAVASSTLQAETTALRERVAELEALLADALALQVRVCAARLQPTWAVRGAQCSSSCHCLVLAAGLTPPVAWARFCC